MLKPCGHRLKIQVPKQEEVDPVLASARKAGFELINSNSKREDASVDVGTVVEIGPTAWNDFNSPPWCKVGDTIVFAKFAGKVVADPETLDEYHIINDADVIAVIKES